MGLMRVLHDLVLDAKQEHDLAPVMKFIHENLGKTQAQLREVTIACKSGCWFCCSRWVDAKIPEILYVSRGLEERPDSILAVEGAFRKFGSLNFEERKFTVTVCPMLSDDRCSVYSRRPVACRLAVSRDAEICERSYLETNEPIPRPQVYNTTGSVYSVALTGALWRAGLDHRAYELTGGIRAAITTPDAERRWLDGEQIFAGINRRAADPLDDPGYRAMVEEAFR
jgi:Fe-S-cluster containining protein